MLNTGMIKHYTAFVSSSLLSTGIILMSAFAFTARSGVKPLPVAPEDTISKVFKLTVDGQAVPVAFEKFNGNKSFHYASFEMDEEVTAIIHSESAKALTIRPRSAGVVPERQGNSWTVKIDTPRPLVIEEEGQCPMLLFALPPEKNIPSATDKGVLYFGPGIHKVGEIRLKSDQSVYLAPGALVKGRFYGFEIENVTISGRGIIDARGFTSANDKTHGILFERSKNIKISGIQLRTGDWWQCLFLLCDNIKVERIHCLSFGRNNDGIDIDGVTNLKVSDCFIGCGDDGFGWHALDAVSFGEPATRNCSAERCVIWNEYAGNGLRLGASMETRVFENISFRDIDVLHVSKGGVAIMSDHSDWAHLRNVLFENFHNDTDHDLMLMFVKKTRYSNKTGYRDERGRISDIYFSRVSSRSPKATLYGADEQHRVENLWFSNCRLGNKDLKDRNMLKTNGYVGKLNFVDELPPRRIYPDEIVKGRKLKELVVDNTSKEFSFFGGEKTKSITNASAEGGACQYFSSLGWGYAATYTPELEGVYTIEVKWGSHTDVATKAPWTVKSADGYKTVIFNQNMTPGWHSLGKFKLDARSWVKLVDPHYIISDGPVVADAVRFYRAETN